MTREGRAHWLINPYYKINFKIQITTLLHVKTSGLHKKTQLYFQQKLESFRIQAAMLFPRTGRLVLRSWTIYHNSMHRYVAPQCQYPWSEQTIMTATIRTNRIPLFGYLLLLYFFLVFLYYSILNSCHSFLTNIPSLLSGYEIKFIY